MTPCSPTGSASVLYCTILPVILLVADAHCSLRQLVEAVASFDNTSDSSGAELCIFTTANSSLEQRAPELLRRLIASYPTTFVHNEQYIDVRMQKLATMVLLDATAFEYEFPAIHIRTLLNGHPCYSKAAKFVILVSRASFERRENVLNFLQKLAVLNFIIVLTDTGTRDSLAVYTSNPFTNRQHHFRSTDRPVAQFFPDKLRDLNGYQFTVHAYPEYPYTVMLLDRPGGVVINFIDYVIKRQRNGTTYYTQDKKFRRVVDCCFGDETTRRSFMHTIYLREESGVHVVCPVRQERDFLQHLLKPFSLGVWLVLGGLFACCRVLERVHPAIYRYDLIGLTFFGGGGTAHEQPFQLRVVTLTLAVLVFFLSEAYNTKIISLMSYSKFYEQPQTLDELAHSDFRIMSTMNSMEMFGALEPSFLSIAQTKREEQRLGNRVYEFYCTLMPRASAILIVSSILTGVEVPLYIVQEPLIVDRLMLQFNQHSAFFELFTRSFHQFNDAGLWSCMLNRYMYLLERVESNTRGIYLIQEVIFNFDDLTCVWILIIVGWLASGVGFLGEHICYRVQRRNMRARKHEKPLRPFEASNCVLA